VASARLAITGRGNLNVVKAENVHEFNVADRAFRPAPE
jgi:hypothetical protein